VYQVTLHDELSRVMVHGLLHLLGYVDQTKDEKAIMTAKEDYYLSLQPKKLH
jgi:rRNA maturation RNase YbeY